jgi:glycine cleavage system transcriptional repressor
MVLVVELPDGVEVEALEAALAAPAARLDLGLAVREIGELTPRPVPGPHCVLSVYGADHPGIVHRVVTVLADAQVNITDLETRVIGEPEDPVYAMVLEVVLPAELELEDLQAQVAALATDVGVEASIRTADADVL